MVIDLSKLRLHDVLYGIGFIYTIMTVVLAVMPATGPFSLTPDVRNILVASLAIIVAAFTQLHKMGYDVPDLTITTKPIAGVTAPPVAAHPVPASPDVSQPAPDATAPNPKV